MSSPGYFQITFDLLNDIVLDWIFHVESGLSIAPKISLWRVQPRIYSHVSLSSRVQSLHTTSPFQCRVWLNCSYTNRSDMSHAVLLSKLGSSYNFPTLKLPYSCIMLSSDSYFTAVCYTIIWQVMSYDSIARNSEIGVWIRHETWVWKFECGKIVAGS